MMIMVKIIRARPIAIMVIILAMIIIQDDNSHSNGNTNKVSNNIDNDDHSNL